MDIKVACEIVKGDVDLKMEELNLADATSTAPAHEENMTMEDCPTETKTHLLDLPTEILQLIVSGSIQPDPPSRMLR